MIVHHLDQAKAVLAAAEYRALPIQLRSAGGAASTLGVGYLHDLGEAVGRELVVDCDDDAGLVLAALRVGCRQLLFDGPDDTYGRLSQIGERYGASIIRPGDRTHPCLSLSPADDATTIGDWLDAHTSR